MTPVLEWCTTEMGRRRHLSDQLVPDRHAPRTPGRSGPTLCGKYGGDQERINAPRPVYDIEGLSWSMVAPARQVVVADLLACRKCVRCATAFSRPLPALSAVGGESR